MKRKQSMSVSLLHALFLYKRPTAKAGRMRSRRKIQRMFLRYGVSGFSLTSKWCPLGIACGDPDNPFITEKKRENKRYNEKKRDTTSEATRLQIALKNVRIRDNNIRAF